MECACGYEVGRGLAEITCEEDTAAGDAAWSGSVLQCQCRLYSLLK